MARIVARCAALLAAALLAGAASPGGDSPLVLAAPSLPLVVTAPQSAAPASVASPAFLPAPVPDLELDDALHKPGPAKVELTPNLFHQRPSYWGEGYTPNSTVEGEQNRKLRPIPGLNLSVPLE